MRRRLESLSGIVLALILVPMWASTAGAAWPRSAFTPQSICDAVGWQVLVEACPDGSGGMFVTWTDLRGAGYDVYLTRVRTDGTIAPGWPEDGLAVASNHRLEALSTVVPDGAGGVYVAWSDSTVNHWDIRINRYDGAGSVAPGWPAGGLLVSNSNYQERDVRLALEPSGGVWAAWHALSTSDATEQVKVVRLNANGTYAAGFAVGGITYRSHPSDVDDISIVTDGAGGAYLAWTDFRNQPTTSTDVYGQRIQPNGTPYWTPQGIPLSDQTGPQQSIVITSDGAGRFMAAWEDARSGNLDIYAQVYRPDGTRVFAADLPVSDATGAQSEPEILWDGKDSAFIAWWDERSGTSVDLYVQRVRVSGITMWTNDGVAVATGAGDQIVPRMALDGEGGVMAVWADDRVQPFIYDLYAQRLDPAGTRLWATNGIPLMRGNSHSPGSAVPDGRGGLLYASYALGPVDRDVVAQRLDRQGIVGDPAPPAIAVFDVPNDQGGFVRVSWDASTHDAGPDDYITHYGVWRAVPAFAALAAIERGEAIVTGTREAVTSAAEAAIAVAPRVRRLRTSLLAGQTTYWELVGMQVAHQIPGYSMVVATTSDSIGGSNPYTRFQVEALRDDRGIVSGWFSAPDSGYSVDNLAPPTPSPFVVNFQGDTKYLHWGVSPAPDRRGYRVYRGVTADFALNNGTFRGEVTDTNHVDIGPAPFYFYKVTAVDIHGNESVPALVIPPGTVDVGDAPSWVLAFAAPQPNPSSGPVTLRWSQPVDADVSLRIYDPAGREVGSVAEGLHRAGEHSARWTPAAGIAPGVYFVRLEVLGRTFLRRIARVR